jgi:hypothetical protein
LGVERDGNRRKIPASGRASMLRRQESRGRDRTRENSALKRAVPRQKRTGDDKEEQVCRGARVGQRGLHVQGLRYIPFMSPKEKVSLSASAKGQWLRRFLPGRRN